MTFAAVAAILAPTAVRAADAKSPSLVLRIKSIDGILQDARYFAKLAGQEDALKQVDEVLKAYDIGIDRTKPIGLYAAVSPNLQESPVVLLIPVSNEDTFVKALAGFNITAKKGDDGVFTLENLPNNVPVAVYFRFAHGYACVTVMEKANISKENLLDPTKVLPKEDAVLALSLRLSDLPDLAKQLAIQQLDSQLAQAKEKKEPNEPPAVTKFRETMIDKVGEHVKDIITDGDELTLRLDVNTSKDDVALDASFKAKPGSKLSKEMKEAGAKSLFTGLASNNDAIRFLVSVLLPEDLRKTIAPAVDEAAKKMIEEQKDETKKALAKAAMEALGPTIKAGELDIGGALHGPDSAGHFTAIGGIKVKSGQGINDFVHQISKDLPEKDKSKIVLDAETVGDMKIHKITVDKNDENAKKMFGTDTVYLGIGDNMVLVGIGPDALSEMKSAATATAAAAPALSATVSVARAASLDEKDKNAAKTAKQVFGANPNGNDTVSITVETGETVRLQIKVKGKVIAFGALSEAAKQEK
jgi:hypothetical protein